MALLWKKLCDGTLYEVRTAGSSCRLYKGGVLHSQFNPRHPLSGQVWDLLMLPAFFHHPEKTKRVLMLGVGGGAVIRQLQHFIKPEQIVGIELDPIHLTIARRFFAIKGRRVQLHRENARHWVRHYDGPPFDLVIDDLFTEQDREPVRAVETTRAWVASLAKHLSNHGTLVVNFPSPAALNSSPFCCDTNVIKRFSQAYQLTVKRNENAVGVFLKTASSSHQLSANLTEVPLLNPHLKSCRLQYQIEKIV